MGCLPDSPDRERPRPMGFTIGRAADLLPFPASDTHKYARGKVVVVAGSPRYPGAAVLAARAAQRMGAGYVEAVVSAPAVLPVRIAGSSLVVSDRDEWDPLVLESSPGRPLAVLVGCGFDAAGDAGECSRLLRLALDRAACPVVVDGGALGLAACDEMRRALRLRAGRGFATVLTPHAGEAALLAEAAGLPGDFLSDPPWRSCERLAQAYSAIVCLKGPDTFVSDGSETYAIDQGGPELAKAGTGDVLAGMAAALAAQRQDDVFRAVATAVSLHAEAGRLAADDRTSIGVIPEDVVEKLGAAIKWAASYR